MTDETNISIEADKQRDTITKARKEAKVSQAELAKRVGVHWITISRLERGVIPVTTDWTFRILRALKADMDGTILYGMMKRGTLVTGSIVPSNRVQISKNVVVSTFNTKPFTDDSRWYQMLSMDWDPIARLGDVVRFTKPSGPDWMFAYGRLCLAQGSKKKFVQCGILRTGGAWFEEANPASYKLETMDGKLILQHPFTLVGVATTVMYNNFPKSKDGPTLMSRAGTEKEASS